MATAPKVWFITGTSKGFGRIWAEAALQRGDKVVATARNPRTLDGLASRYGANVLPLALDVNSQPAVEKAVKLARDHFGRLDVVVNNAGFGLFGTIEEITTEQARAQMETNFFGALWVTKAALPILREQKSGHIIQVSSIGGVQAFPTLGLYHASKWALEGFSQALAAEVARLRHQGHPRRADGVRDRRERRVVRAGDEAPVLRRPAGEARGDLRRDPAHAGQSAGERTGHLAGGGRGEAAAAHLLRAPARSRSSRTSTRGASPPGRSGTTSRWQHTGRDGLRSRRTQGATAPHPGASRPSAPALVRAWCSPRRGGPRARRRRRVRVFVQGT